MATTEQIMALRVLSEEKDQLTLQTYLAMAEEAIMNKIYPFGYGDETEVPQKYFYKVVQIANVMLAKRGAEGESVHNENGINRTYEGMDELLADVVPFGGTFG